MTGGSAGGPPAAVEQAEPLQPGPGEHRCRRGARARRRGRGSPGRRAVDASARAPRGRADLVGPLPAELDRVPVAVARAQHERGRGDLRAGRTIRRTTRRSRRGAAPGRSRRRSAASSPAGIASRSRSRTMRCSCGGGRPGEAHRAAAAGGRESGPASGRRRRPRARRRRGTGRGSKPIGVVAVDAQQRTRSRAIPLAVGA